QCVRVLRIRRCRAVDRRGRCRRCVGVWRERAHSGIRRTAGDRLDTAAPAVGRPFRGSAHRGDRTRRRRRRWICVCRRRVELLRHASTAGRGVDRWCHRRADRRRRCRLADARRACIACGCLEGPPIGIDMTSSKPLRLWPGIVFVTLEWLLWTVFSLVAPAEQAVLGMLGGAACGLVVLLWWLFFSRAPWVERLGALALMILAVPVAYRFAHQSVTTAAMGNLLMILSIPAMTLALVVWAVASQRLSSGRRRAWMAVAISLACASLGLVRIGGVSGDGVFDIHWRWTPTPEDRLLARVGNEPVTPAPTAAATPTEKPAPPEPIAPAPATAPPVPAVVKAPATKESAAPATAATTAAPVVSERGFKRAEWPGFRGPGRDRNIRGVRIETDWDHTPPVALWHKPIGPGWSSFAINGDVFDTQEQRGEDEIVSAYHVKTGEPVWTHRDAARFFEGNAGPGPPGPPALSGERGFTPGATGIVNALNALDGSVLWSRNSSTDTGAPMPGW